jgi:hypothetical protein
MLGWLRRIGGRSDGSSLLTLKGRYVDAYEVGFLDGYERGFSLFGVTVVPPARLEVAMREADRHGRANAEYAFRDHAFAGHDVVLDQRATEELYVCGYGGGYVAGVVTGYRDVSSGKHPSRTMLLAVLPEGERRGRARWRRVPR